MKKLLLLPLLWLLSVAPALAQTTPFSTYVLGLAAVGSPTGAEKIVVVSGGVPKTLTPNQILAFVSGDCTIVSPPSIVCLKTNGVNFVASATTDTTNAANISSGTLALPRLALTSAFFYVGNGSNNPAGVAMSGDCTLANTGAVTCLKAGGVTLAASATTDTTVATNITTGTLAGARYSQVALGSSGNGGVGGALPFANMPTGSLDQTLGYYGSTTLNAIGVPNCTAGALQYSTTTHVYNCNVGAGAGTVTSITAADTSVTLTPNPIVGTGTVKISAARQTLPTVQTFTSGSSATYTRPANVLWIRIRAVGGGGGGAGGGNLGDGGSGSSGSATSFATVSAFPGAGGLGVGTGGTGNSASGGNVFNITGGGGGGGSSPNSNANGSSGMGGNSCLGGGGNSIGGATTGPNGAVNSGGGGAGGGVGNVAFSGYGGGGGGAGGCLEHIIQTPAATYTYTVGGGGGGGSAGTNGGAGGSGAAGIIIVEEHYGS